MSGVWRDDDEDFRMGDVKGGRVKARFTYKELKVLLDAVKKNRYILLKQFNSGVSVETKKNTWIEITNQINGLGENRREVRQIMKKWADLKCDGKRRILALRGPNGSNLRKKHLGPVEKMVHRILTMNPKDDADVDQDEDDDFRAPHDLDQTLSAPPYSYLSLNENSWSVPEGSPLDMSPPSSPEKDLGDPLNSSSELDLADDADQTLDFDEVVSSHPPSSPEPPPSDSRMRIRPVHTYSRTSQNPSGPPPASSSSAAAPPPSPPRPSSSSSSSVKANGAPPPAASSSSSIPPPPPPPPPSSSDPSDLLPPGSSQSSSQALVAQLASQSVEQQRAGRLLLTSVSCSLKTLAQSVQLLVESQQELVQESLLLQREALDVLRDFSNTTLRMLREKSSSEQPRPPALAPPPHVAPPYSAAAHAAPPYSAPHAAPPYSASPYSAPPHAAHQPASYF